MCPACSFQPGCCVALEVALHQGVSQELCRIFEAGSLVGMIDSAQQLGQQSGHGATLRHNAIVWVFQHALGYLSDDLGMILVERLVQRSKFVSVLPMSTLANSHSLQNADANQISCNGSELMGVQRDIEWRV